MGDLEEEMGEGELDTWSLGAAVRAPLPSAHAGTVAAREGLLPARRHAREG